MIPSRRHSLIALLALVACNYGPDSEDASVLPPATVRRDATTMMMNGDGPGDPMDSGQTTMTPMDGAIDTDAGLLPMDYGVPVDAGTATTTADGGNTTPDAGFSTPDAGFFPDTGGMCVDLTVYADADSDGWGVADMTTQACLAPMQEVAGYSRRPGDCGPNDPVRYPTAEEICDDNVDDDCDGDLADDVCPTTNSAGINVPSWDCITGAPPSNVYAWSLFSNGGTYYQPNGCFVFFEGLPDEFYVQKVNLVGLSNDSSCSTISGCICPSLAGWPSYDRRLYAFTTHGDPATCPPLTIIDHGGEQQAVSNDCRKYLYQLHWYDIPYSYVSGNISSLDQRLSYFDKVEIACTAEQYQQLPFATLLTEPIQRNAGFIKQ